MTLTPRDLALASIAAPEPESRFTSSRTFAPFVIICSACCCWVDLSPWALSMVTGTPAFLNASCSSGRSKDSQRTDDWVSGSSTATFWALALLDELVELLDELLCAVARAACRDAERECAQRSGDSHARDATSVRGFTVLLLL